MASYTELALRISADIREFEKSMNTMTGKLKSMSDKALPASRAVAGGLIAVGAAALGLGAKAVSLAAEIEQVEVAFSTLLGSEEATGKMIKNLQDFAASTPFQFPGLADAARSLVAFGVDADETIPTLKRIGDISAGISAPIGDIAEIYGKARVQGRLFAEDINQLTGRGIPIIGELAKQFGVSESEVRKLTESGLVNFEHLEQAFIALTSEGGKFEGMMEAQSQTVAGKWSTLKDNIGLTLTSIGQTIIETFDLKGVIDRAIEFTANIRTSFEDFAAKVEELGLKEALAQIFSEETKMKMVLIAGAIVGALVPAMYAFATSVIAATVPLLPFIAAGAAIAGLAYLIYKNWDGIKDFFARVWTGIVRAIRGPANTIIGFANGIISAYELMINAVARAINRIPKFEIPSWVPVVGGQSFGLPRIPTVSLPRIPLLKTGTNYVPQDMLAFLHKGEAVTPKQYNPAAGGGTTMHHTFDPIRVEGVNSIGEFMGSVELVMDALNNHLVQRKLDHVAAKNRRNSTGGLGYA